MKQYKTLLKDFGVLTISSFASKILVFLLVPLYTSILSTEDYGSYDIISTTISLLVPILTLSISDGAIRFLLDKKNDSKEVISVTFKIAAVGVLIFSALLIANNIFNIVPIFNDYIIYFALLFFVNIFYRLSEGVTRGLYKLKDIAIAGLVGSVLTILLNLFFLLVLKTGLNGYFLANIIAIGVSGAFLFIKSNIYKYLSSKKTDKGLRKEMVKYSRPLVLNEIGWWINNVSDRYVVSFICGIAENGIYSVAYKIPSILTTLQSVFNQAWTISVIKNMDSDDQKKYLHNVYSIYNVLIVIICSALIIFSKDIAAVLFRDEFFVAWKFSPFLLVSVVFGSMSGTIGGIFSALKKTRIMGYTTLIGAVLNTLFNIILVLNFGAIGAAISTMISFFFVWLVRYRRMKKHMDIGVNVARDLFAYLILLIQSIILLCLDGNLWSYLLNFALIIVLVILYRKEIWTIMKKIYAFLKRKKHNLRGQS